MASRDEDRILWSLLIALAVLLLLALLSEGCAPLVDPITERPGPPCDGAADAVRIGPDHYRCPRAAGGPVRP